MPTWRWLGVNEALWPELPEKKGWPEWSERSAVPERIVARAGEKEEYVNICRNSGLQELQVDIEEGAELHLVNVQLVPQEEPSAGRVKVHVGEGAVFSYTAVEAGASASVSELVVELAGRESRADVAALYFADEERSVDMNYIIRQQGHRTDADMQIRGALLGRSRKIFRGTLDFLEGAKGSVGRENEEVIVLSPYVSNRSVPLMLSHEDDVDGHHAVSIGKMDEEKLFYLMSRGLDLAEARRLVVEASFRPVLDRIPDAELRSEIDVWIKGRLQNAG